MRVLFCGDSAGTGFGTVTKDLGSAMLAEGVDIRFVSINEQPEGEMEEPFVGRTAIIGDTNGWLSTGRDPLTGLIDQDVAIRTANRMEGMFVGRLFDDGWTPDAAIILGDVGSLQVSPILRFIPEGFPAFHYVPIEGDGLPPAWAQLWRNLQPVAMCEFGADQIETVTGARPPVVYHGVNTGAFWPVSATRPIYIDSSDGTVKLHSKDDCKRFFGLNPTHTIVFRADRLMRRKMYPAWFRSLAPVLARHPEVDLIWHCASRDFGGIMTDETSKYPGLSRQMFSTGFHDKYNGVPRVILNALYNAADIYASNSSEGFGLTIAEALACGVPVVGQGWSSVPEVVGPAGITVPIWSKIDNEYSYFWGWTDEVKYGEAVEALIVDPARRKALGALGPAHIRATFDWADKARQFISLIGAALPLEVAA